jgi:hypothetical protein
LTLDLAEARTGMWGKLELELKLKLQVELGLLIQSPLSYT